ncbi:MAG TPA: alpha-2-macroglobulin [Bacillota bacterium]|nr:alpha-2-macroglobulin [Bacillota bacterium]HPO98548.1 alpha-2-macroglobulin [Bacillota bacterium]
MGEVKDVPELHNIKSLKRVINKKTLALSLGAFLLVFIIYATVSSISDRGIKLVTIEPSGEISVKTNLNFIFSADVVEQNDVGINIDRELVKFKPSIPGRFRWISKRELRFLPEATFRPATQYTAEINSNIVKVKDRFLTGDRIVKFKTQRFQVEEANISFQYPGGQQRGLVLQSRIQFNYPVAAAELEKSLVLRFAGSKKDIAFNLNSTDNSKVFNLTSEILQLAAQDKKIELIITKGLRCIDGELGMESDYKIDSVLGAKKRLEIVEASPKNDESKCWIAVRCSETVDAKSINEFIKLKPAVPFQAEVDGDYIYIKSNKFGPGESFNLMIRAGLGALNGYPLSRDYSATVAFEDLEPSLKFNTPGRYLSSKGNLNLGLETVNVERINIEVSQIYANNIVPYLNNLNYEGYCYTSEIKSLGRVAKSTIINIDSPKNEMVTTPINLKEYLGDHFRGILQVVVYNDDYRWLQDTKYVIITDLGIVSKMADNELTVWINSLDTLAAKEKTKVTLISRNNQTLAQEYTDSQGIARFKNIKKVTAGFEPFIILAEQGDDFAFVHFPSSRIATTDFDVRGRQHLVDGYEAFLYLDRDIFRPGDQGNLVAIVRGNNAAIPPEFPVKLEIRQPDGQIFKELLSNTANRGAAEFAIAIPEYAQTGKYQTRLLVAEEPVGSTSFSVEDFMPERIKVTTHLERKEYRVGDVANIKVEGINLFGPPAAGRRTELKLTLEPAPFTAAGYTSYTFGDPSQSFSVKEQELGEGKLDNNGVATYSYTFPKGLTPPAKLRAVFQGTVIEDGGRAVSSFKVADLHPYERYIGLKALSDYYCELNKPYRLKYVVLDQAGKPVANSELVVEVYHITWNTIYRRNSEGNYEYVSEEERTRVYKGSLVANGGEQLFEYVPKEYGQYQIVLKDAQSPSQALIKFYASGWGYNSWAMEEPDKIQLELGKKVYQVGEQAEIQIKAPFSGKALVTVEREKVFDLRIVEFKENTGYLKIPVKEEYKPNVYVSVHLIRSIKSLEKKAPVRAFGTIPLMVDCSNHKLQLELGVANEIRPQRDMEVTVKLNQNTENTYLTLAAVDEGICQLTDYQAPNPLEFFYGKRSLTVNSYDLYGMVLPEVENKGVRSKSAPSGDADADGVRKRNLNPVAVKRVKPVSLWSGLVKVDRNGVAKIKLRVPQFNGTLRLMAVAASGNNFGMAQKKVIVRDPIVISPTLPRFVASNDHFEVPVSVFNGTGKDGEFQIELKLAGPVELISQSRQKLSLKNQEEKQLIYELKAKNSIGKLTCTVQARGNGENCTVIEELSVRPPVPLTTEFSSGGITAKRPLVLDPDNKWLPGTASYELVLAPLPTLKFAGSLQYLLAYPHGCVEQTTSKLFPLLYFDSLAQATNSAVFKGGNANYYISEGIDKLESMQLRDGSFAYWPGETYSNEWSSIYAAHFLVEARKAGFAVSDRVYDRMINYLDSLAKLNDKSAQRLEVRIYALYVLSVAGKAQLSSMAYLKNFRLNELSDYSRAQLAAAYYYLGDRRTARELLPVTFTASAARRQTGGNFNSSVRSDAIILSALADIDPINKAIHKLVTRLSDAAKPGSWGTTQENAFALMALGKIYQKKSEGNYQGEVLVNNKRIATFDSQKPLKITDEQLGKGRVEVKINGNGECYYFFKVSGVPNAVDVREYSNGLVVNREFLDRFGNQVARDQISQGDLLITHLTITTKQDNLEHVAITDLLPAGLEIENPRIASSAKIAWLQDKSITPDYLDLRDDRLIIFKSFEKSGTYHFYYAVRVVTCGDFILPSVKAECMYEPEISSYSSSGQIKVNRY